MLVTTTPYPKSLTCVKSFASILLLPAPCRTISIGPPAESMSSSKPAPPLAALSSTSVAVAFPLPLFAT